MSRTAEFRPSTGAVLAVAAAIVIALSGCSGRDTDMSEKLAAVDAAARRAEAAASRAESAAKTSSSASAQQTAEAEIDPEDDGTSADPAAQDPNSGAFNNSVG